MSTRYVSTLLLTALLCGVPLLARDDGTHETVGRLIDRMLASDRIDEDLRWLCDRIGGRPTGSEACRRAVIWARDQFRDAGISVKLEPFTMPALWLPGPNEASAVFPESFTLRATAVPGSPSTLPGRPIEAPLVDAGDGSPEAFRRLGPRAEGAIALIATEPMKSLSDLLAEYMRNRSMLEAAAESRVAGLLLMSTRPRGLLYRHPVTLVGGPAAPVPVTMISREDATRLARLLGDEPENEIRLRLSIRNRTGGAYESHNVVAEIPGRERPAEVVLVGAHLDSWDLGTGAQDNGVNVVTLLDLARGMKQLGLVPRRTVRFVLFTGEEAGLVGSSAYVESHADELDAHVAAVVVDIGSGRIRGFYLNGRESLREPIGRALEPVEDLGPFTHSILAIDGTDNFDFLLAGVPNLVADQEPSAYLPDYHAESDVYDVVDRDQARRNAAILASLIWGLAERDSRPAPRQTRAEVESLIETSNLEPAMRAFGQWDDWVQGRRGALRPSLAPTPTEKEEASP